MVNKFIIISLVLLLTGCLNVKEARLLVVSDAMNSKMLNAITVDCSDLGLTRNCDNYNGANKVVTVDGITFRVAADHSGSKILVMYSNEECSFTEGECMTNSSNLAYHVVKNTFDKAGINVIDIKPLVTTSIVSGYLLWVDDDGYSLLN